MEDKAKDVPAYRCYLVQKMWNRQLQGTGMAMGSKSSGKLKGFLMTLNETLFNFSGNSLVPQ